MPRAFRSKESYAAEHKTRGKLRVFLEERGFTGVVDKRIRHGSTESQTLRAIDDIGRPVTIAVRLCWRRGRGKATREAFSAAQLVARVKDDDWIGTLKNKIKRMRALGATHLLLVQRDKNGILYAASVPIEGVVPIWTRQRNISKRLIDTGKLGKRRKNHAMNGSSPTLWLQDDKAPAVGAALWNYPGVRDLAKLPLGFP